MVRHAFMGRMLAVLVVHCQPELARKSPTGADRSGQKVGSTGPILPLKSVAAVGNGYKIMACQIDADARNPITGIREGQQPSGLAVVGIGDPSAL
jgi:hypothetical protein